MDGAVVSTITTKDDVVALFPAPSVAVHSTVVVPSAKEVGLYEIVEEAVTLSVDVACVREGVVVVPVASKLCVEGAAIEGAASSATITLNVDVPVLPEESVTEQRILVVPSANCVPDCGLQVVESAPSTTSDALGFVKDTDAPSEEVAEAVTSAWNAIVGIPLSMMTTSDVVFEKFPEASVAVHVTVVVPSANEIGLCVMTGLGSAKSIAVADVSVGVVEVPVAGCVCVAGAVITGAVVSSKVMKSVKCLLQTTRSEPTLILQSPSAASCASTVP